MAQWVRWEDDKGFNGVVRHLPASLEGRDAGTLATLGYRERVTRQPEDFIPRFPALLGSAKFELLPDGRVLETFPDADFSVQSVRRELKMQAKQDAGNQLGRTDWYIVRNIELGQEVPAEITSLRKKIRDHVEWLEADIDTLSPRALVEYTWRYPSTDAQIMVNGVPVVFTAEPPIPPVPLPEPPPPVDPITGEAINVFGNSDPEIVDPAEPPPPAPTRNERPATTDGPVPVFQDGEETHHLNANGVPLVTVYAPNVDDPGPQPDNQ